jgi:thymidylate synthase (FAD)
MKDIKVNLLHSTPKDVLKTALEKPYSSEFKDSSFEKIAHKVINKMKHESVAEHINYNFEILGISRLCLQELVRHRIAGYTVKSTRFTLSELKNLLIDVDLDPYDYNRNIILMSKFFCYPENESLSEHIYNINYKFLREFNISKNSFKNDELKYLLPENYRTDLVMSINARSLTNFLKLRIGDKNNKPHFEIKHLAKLMLEKALSTDTGFLFSEIKND